MQSHSAVLCKPAANKNCCSLSPSQQLLGPQTQAHTLGLPLLNRFLPQNTKTLEGEGSQAHSPCGAWGLFSAPVLWATDLARSPFIWLSSVPACLGFLLLVGLHFCIFLGRADLRLEVFRAHMVLLWCLPAFLSSSLPLALPGRSKSSWKAGAWNAGIHEPMGLFSAV